MNIGSNKFDKATCIIVDKIFTQCKDNACIPNVEVPIENKKIKKIRFQQGFIIDETLKIHDISSRPNFKRVVFEVKIPIQLHTYEGNVYTEILPNIKQDIVLFMPYFKRSEFNFNIEVETQTRILGDIMELDSKIYFTAEIALIISVVGRVQLMIPYLDFCPEPPLCIDFEIDDLCEKFYDEPFPDFYPPQLRERKKIKIRKDIKVRKVNDVIIHGQIKKCYTKEPIKGAIIKAFYTDEKGELKDICHTYSGCNGYYMLRIPPYYQGKTITVMATKDNCDGSLKPCDCMV